MNFIHKNLASEKWQKMSLVEQMANIGSEVNRTIHWYNEDDKETMKNSAWRTLELIDLTIIDKRWKNRLLEILRLREVFCDLFFGKNLYNTSTKSLQDYFLLFGLAARKFK